VDISIQPRLNFGRFTVMVLRSYLIVDPRVKDLVLVVKTWSKRRMINEAFQGTLNSFSLILMVIHVLQNVEPPVLPNIFLPTLPLRNATSPSPASPSSASTPSPSSHKHIYLGARKPLAAIDGVDGHRKIVSFHRDEEALRGWGASNKDPLSVLLLRFFCYYATEYDWASDCVSIVRGCVIKVGVADLASQMISEHLGRRRHVRVHALLDGLDLSPS
jgi:DNA polymerase sigma